MKEIQLTQGKVALVDDADFDYLNQWKWYAQKDRNTFYAVRRDGKKRMKMHRVILGLDYDDKCVPDHIDLNGLNNQRYNLRIATKGQNSVNRPPTKNSVSRYKGVSPMKKRWQVHIVKDGVQTYLGLYKSETEAAIAYNEAAKKLHGEFAYLNKIAV